MRFAVAVAVLAQALPVSSQSGNGSPPFGSILAGALQNVRHSPFTNKTPKKNGKSAAPFLTGRGLSGPLVNGKTKKSRVSPAGLMKNMLRQSSMSKSDQGCLPDTGLLACGIGQYCQRDDNYSLGGVCTAIGSSHNQGRDMKQHTRDFIGWYYCESSDAANFADSCDCSDWDGPTGTYTGGAVTCELRSNYCMNICPDLCFDYDMTYFRDASGTYGVRKCIRYIEPYEQSLCSVVYDDFSCKLYLDGEECSVCDLTSTSCGEFDCTNVGMGRGDFCNPDFYAPVVVATCPSYFGTSPYEPCYLCDGGGVVYPDSQFYLPTYGFYDCSLVDSYALSGDHWDSDTCAWFTDLVQSSCCEQGNSPTSPPVSPYDPCYLCDGEGVVYPDSYVYFEGYGFYICSYLDDFAQSGNYWDDYSCSAFSAYVRSSCCIHPYDPCYLCDGKSVVYPYSEFYVPYLGQSYGCDLVDWMALSGTYFDEEYCSYFADLVASSCCSSDPTSRPTASPIDDPIDTEEDNDTTKTSPPTRAHGPTEDIKTRDPSGEATPPPTEDTDTSSNQIKNPSDCSTSQMLSQMVLGMCVLLSVILTAQG